MSEENNKLAPTTQEEMDRLIANRFGSALSKAELAHFLTVAKSANLNPLRNQLYAIKRGGKLTFQTGIDGFRAIAARSGQHVGTNFVHHRDKDGKLLAVTCTVLKLIGDKEREWNATAEMHSYNQGTPIWKKYPLVMLEKCAESLALRRAFPEDLSGLHTAEEMGAQKIDVAAEARVVSDRFDNEDAPEGIDYEQLEEQNG